MRRHLAGSVSVDGASCQKQNKPENAPNNSGPQQLHIQKNDISVQWLQQ